MGRLHKLAVCYNESNKRLLNLQQYIDSECPDSSCSRLKLHCTTLWVEKKDAVLVFHKLYSAVIASLDDLSVWSGDTGGKAVWYMKSMDDGFLLAVEIRR